MFPQTYFPVGLPHGVVLGGYIYTTASPSLDEKAGFDSRKIRLIERQSGLEIELARSSSAIEFQRFSFGLAEKFIRSRRKTISQNIQRDDVVSFLSEIYRLMVISYEDTLNRDITKRMDNKFRSETIDKLPEIDPRKIRLMHAVDSIMKPFDSPGIFSEVYDYDDLVDPISSKREIEWEDYFKDSVKGILSELARSAEAYRYMRKIKALDASYPDLNSDLLAHFIKEYIGRSKGLLYTSWDERKPITLMAECSAEAEDAEKGIKLIVNGDEHYFKTEYSFSNTEFQLGLALLAETSLMNTIPALNQVVTDKVNLGFLSKIFPVRLKNGVIRLKDDDDLTMSVELRFPAYAMVNPAEKTHVFLMDSGILTFDYSSGLVKAKGLESYKVTGGSGEHYYHFFVSSGGKTICGFRPMENAAMPLSQLVTENFYLGHAVLTHGLKGDTGYNKIGGVKANFKGKTIEIMGTQFPKYVERSVIEEFNKNRPEEKQILIGEGV